MTLKDAQFTGLDPAAFDVAIQAADDTQTKRDVKDVVTAALDKASLAIASVQVPVAIKDARLRIDPTTFQSGNARAIISGGYDLPADQVDIRTSLRSTTLGVPGPEIQVFIHGTPDALQRDVDVSLLSSWLSLRAIERETKRLDDLEKGNVASPSPNANQSSQTPPDAARPSSDVRLPGIDPKKHRPQRPPVVRAPAVSRPNVTASDQQLAPLPPPIDIRPAPGAARPRRPPAPLPSTGATF
jgi:large subunit ribosomal protein L24